MTSRIHSTTDQRRRHRRQWRALAMLAALGLAVPARAMELDGGPGAKAPDAGRPQNERATELTDQPLQPHAHARPAARRAQRGTAPLPLPDPKAAKLREVVEQAHRAYDLALFSEAAQLYSEAYDLEAMPALLFNLGQCHRQLGDGERALFFYRRYLDHSADGKFVPVARELVSQLEAARAEREAAQTALAAAAVPSAHAAAPAPSLEHRPVWRRWWFWAGVGALAAGGTVAFVATRPPGPTLGTGDLRR